MAATLEDYQSIGASPNGSTEKRRAFLILQKTMNDDSSQEEWERAARILCDIKKSVLDRLLRNNFAGFDDLLKKASDYYPPIVEELHEDSMRNRGDEPNKVKKKWIDEKRDKSAEEIKDEKEDEENLKEYYRIMENEKKKNMGG